MSHQNEVETSSVQVMIDAPFDSRDSVLIDSRKSFSMRM